ncbi:MAG: tripartite tricarboxylate transporter TctB family protein [Roseococcus sp.]
MQALNIGLSLFWVLFGLGLGQQSLALGLGGPGGPGSGLFPLLAASLIILGALGVLIQDLRRGSPSGDVAERFWMARGAAMRVSLLILVMVGMILAVPHLGFALSGALGLTLLFRTIAPHSAWWFALLVGAIAAAIVHLLFAVLLGTPLPRGPLGF